MATPQSDPEGPLVTGLQTTMVRVQALEVIMISALAALSHRDRDFHRLMESTALQLGEAVAEEAGEHSGEAYAESVREMVSATLESVRKAAGISGG